MRNKFFLRLLVFILLFLPLNHALMRAYVRFTRQPYVYEYTRKKFDTLKDQVSLLVAGDSHALDAFNDTLVPDSYNYSSRGESPIHTYFKLRAAFEEPDFQPKVVVMPMDLHTFASYRYDRFTEQDLAFWSQYVDYLEVGREQGDVLPMVGELVKVEFAYLGGLDETLAILFPAQPWEIAGMTKGFRPIHEQFTSFSPEDQAKIAAERSAYHLEGREYITPLEVVYFNRLLDLLEAHQVQIVFVWYPVTELYYQQAERFAPVDDHFATMQSLFADRDNVIWLDYHDLYWDHPEYFSDSDHMNVDGAEVFTELLVHDLAANGVTW